MNKATQRILSMIFAIAAVMAFAAPAYAADQRDIQIDHTYFDHGGSQELRTVTESVSTTSLTPLSDLVYPALSLSGGKYEYNVVNFHLSIYYQDGRPDEVRDWTGAEVATTSFQFEDDSIVRVYEAVVEYDNPRLVTTPVTPPTTTTPTTTPPSTGGGSRRDDDDGTGRSNYLDNIGVIGLPDGPVETGSTVKLTTIPADTSVQYDEAGLSLERLENGDYRFTILRDGVHSITFRRTGYHDRTVQVTGTSATVTREQEPAPLPVQAGGNDTHNPNTGVYSDGGMGATDNPNTGAHGRFGLGWAALLLTGAGVGGMKYAVRRED